MTDDSILAAILLHDVVEDTDTDIDVLPVSDEVREIVKLVTFRIVPGMSKDDSKAMYYNGIAKNKKASLVKIIDRCNNVSTMSASFERKKLIAYIHETEQYIIPLLTILKDTAPEYNNAVFLVKYQLISLLESIKALCSEQ